MLDYNIRVFRDAEMCKFLVFIFGWEIPCWFFCFTRDLMRGFSKFLLNCFSLNCVLVRIKYLPSLVKIIYSDNIIHSGCCIL